MKATLILIGDGGVGKSCLAQRYISDRFLQDYDPTVEESFHKDIDTEQGTLKLEILDTAGQDDFSAIRQTYYRNADLVIGVFDVKNLDTFNKLKDFWEEIIHERHNDKRELPPVLVAGNKIDLVPDFAPSPNITGWLNEHNISEVFYTSSKTDHNVSELFNKAVEVLISKPKSDPKSSTNLNQDKNKKSKCILF